MCKKVFVLCFAFVCLVPVCLCVGEDIGEVCVIETLNTTGICKSEWECPYARKLIEVDGKKPQICKWAGRTRIVCCPVKNLIYATGVFGRMYQGIEEGVKRSKHMTCYYSGNEPMLCCPNKRDAKLPSEEGCPALRIPAVTPSRYNIAWKKCAEYQRFVKRCVSSDNNPDVLIRKNTCKNSKFRISGGVPAEKNEFPHMALIGCADPTETDIGVQWIGGGTLISDRFVLTAGHVLIGPDSRPARYVLLGALNRTDTVNSILYNIVRKIPYPKYKSTSKYYDIALVELHWRVSLSEFIRPACLPVPEITIDNTRKRYVAGWGSTTQNSDPSIILLTTTVIVLDDPGQCHKITSDFVYDPMSMICAIGINNGSLVTDTCRGDSGGPLMATVSNLECSYSVEGVVSFGPSCGIGAAGVYTRVSAYLDWLVANVWPEEAKKTRL